MSTLVLVRHAQARPFERDSDRLSATGEQQAISLGEFWQERGIRFDEVYSGTLRRHTHTAELAGFAEFAAAAGVQRIRRQRHPARRPQRRAGRADNRQLQKLFEAAMPQWIAGTLRVAQALKHGKLFASASSAVSRSIVAGGPSQPARGRVHFRPARSAWRFRRWWARQNRWRSKLNWRIRNCSLTEFVFTRDRISLDSFNATPHLAEVTFR